MVPIAASCSDARVHGRAGSPPPIAWLLALAAVTILFSACAGDRTDTRELTRTEQPPTDQSDANLMATTDATSADGPQTARGPSSRSTDSDIARRATERSRRDATLAARSQAQARRATQRASEAPTQTAALPPTLAMTPIAIYSALSHVSGRNLMAGVTLQPAAYPNAGAQSIVAPLAMPATGRVRQEQGPQENTERYEPIFDNPFKAASDAPLSTFAIDVDTASFSNVRRYLEAGAMPPRDAVRIEELVNYFESADPPPAGDDPFAVAAEAMRAPWRPEHLLLRVGLKARAIDMADRPDANLVFLLDVSGSMQAPNKLPLVKSAMKLLVEQLSENDSVAIAVYAGSSGLVLPPTAAYDRETLLAAIDALEAGGSTHGSAGIRLAYETASSAFIEGGLNRVILATDGDFNVGITTPTELETLIAEQARSGIFLTVLGFGMGNLKDDTLETLANRGNGNYAYVDSMLEARKVLVEEVGGTLVTVAKDVKVQIEFNPSQVAGYRLIGYENRLLAPQDFNDDTKDAGEIGAGHSVTALYELVPAGLALPDQPEPPPSATPLSPAPEAASATEEPEADIDPLRYADPAHAEVAHELLVVKLRHKAPDEEVSVRRKYPVIATSTTLGSPEADTSTPLAIDIDATSVDMHFFASVAAFGMLLRDSPHRGSADLDMVLTEAELGQGADRRGWRRAFVDLVRRAMDVRSGAAPTPTPSATPVGGYP